MQHSKKTVSPQGQLETALQHHQQGRLPEAEAIYLKFPNNPEAMHLLGVLAYQQGQFALAVERINKAIRGNPNNCAYYANLGLAHQELHQLDQAIASFRKAIAKQGDFVDAHFNLGNVLLEKQSNDDAVRCYRKALALNSNHAEAANNLGNALQALHQYEDAAVSCQRALALKPDYVDAHNNLGNILHKLGQDDAAVLSYQKALVLRPDDPQVHFNLGIVLKETGKLELALASYQRAIALKPDHAQAHNNCGIVFDMQDKRDQALNCYRTALALKPDYVEAQKNIAWVLLFKGMLDEAAAALRAALEMKPDYLEAYSMYFFICLYSGSVSMSQLMETVGEFAHHCESQFKLQWPNHPNEKNPDRRLKIGYVSADFRRHAVAYFFEPLIEHHDKSQFELFCYYNWESSDALTERIKIHADHWLPCAKMSDDELAQRIQQDGIDILIDLSGHSSSNRLSTFARKPAPVQVSYLGYPGTTGLTAMDYRISDPYLDPPGMTETFNVEKLWRLPETNSCYRTPDNSPAVVAMAPIESNGFITFACFNNYSKVSDQTLVVWAAILARLPTARLMFEIAGLEDGQFLGEIKARFRRFGIDDNRLILLSRKAGNQFVLYNLIDIALDPFPYNGGTTSFDTLWMGVPFVTLAGTYCSSRMGVAILSCAGLPELIASSTEEYVEIAVALAQDTGRLKQVRSGLRERVQNSPLMDAPRFTTHMEQAYRAMWKTWCAESTMASVGMP